MTQHNDTYGHLLLEFTIGEHKISLAPDAIVAIERNDPGHAHIHLINGNVYNVDEDYDTVVEDVRKSRAVNRIAVRQRG